MKELTIEEKAKAYDEALERIRKELQKCGYTGCDTARFINRYFPELKESEGERIRKELLEHCKNQAKPYIQTGNKCPQIQSWIDWLEKQGSEPNWYHHKVDLSDCSEEYRKAYYDGWNNCNMQHSQYKSESNDVVKCLINGMKFYYEDNEEATWGTEKFSMKVKDILSWLEKQGNKDSQVKLPTFTFDDILALQCCMETVKKVQNDKDLYEKLNDLHGRIYDAYYLEKQGEQKQDVNLQINPSEYINNIGGNGCYLKNTTQTSTWSKKEEKVDNQNCVKSVDDIKPKFKVGDWICNDMCDAHIASIEDGMYYFDEGDGLSIVFVDEHYHLWTIEDAMDGDILMSRAPFIYGKQCPYGGIDWYNEKFIKASNYVFKDSPVHPATKEQCDLLFQKMKEAGYEWDADKKEPKKIETEIEIPFGAKDSELQEATYYIPKGFYAEIDNDKVVIKKGEKPTAWSEEDERRLNFCLNILRPKTLFGSTEITNIDTINTKWLKSLKERIEG